MRRSSADRLGRVEVADRRAGEEHQPRRAPATSSGQRERPREVGHDRQHRAGAGSRRRQRRGRRRGGSRRDVHRHVRRPGGRAGRAAARVFRPLPAPCSTTQRTAGRPRRPSRRRAARRIASLGAGRVVLRQLADAVEQRRARARRRSTCGGRRFRGAGQAREHVGAEAAPSRSRPGAGVPRPVRSRVPREPDAGELPAGVRAGRSCGSVGRTCRRGVTHEPPRSTNWLHMNLPLYSPSAPAAGR